MLIKKIIKQAVQILQSYGMLKDTGEKSFIRRLLRVDYLIKNRKNARQIIPSFWRTCWRVLRGDIRHTVCLPHPVEMDILPSNLAALVKLWGAYPLSEIIPSENRLVWQIAPGVRLPTQTDRGFDIPILYEVFIQKQYGFRYEGLQVLDVGGYKGESALFFLLQGAKSVVSVEPFPPAVEHIRTLLVQNGLVDRVRLFPVAIGLREGEGNLLVSHEDLQSNILEAERLGEVPSTFSEQVRVPVWTFERLLQEIGWETVDVAKLDCEGCEYAIVLHTPEATLKRVHVWIMEFHAGAEPLVSRFRQMGYEVFFEERPDRMGTLRAWKPGARIPW
ncbi:MAG: FkbM family methyltransferase [Bacteroidia bacterium]|nr:FkbM family methyltransferase [Bacteroidia bacterium]